MLYPSIEEFKKLSKSHKRIVLYREIVGDLITPISLLKNFSDEKHLFLLESANLDKSFSRYTFFGFNPGKVIKFRNKQLTIESKQHGIEIIKENPIDYMMKKLENENSHKNSEMGDFCGGYVGFMGYDMVNYMENLRKPISEDKQNINMAFFQVDEFYVFDNLMGKFYAARSVVTSGDKEKAYNNAKERTLEMAVEILSIHKKFTQQEDSFSQKEDFDESSYVNTVEKLKNEIINGECIQTVLSNRYEISCHIDPINLYRTLRNINPSPYMFYIKIEDDVLCGTSPEVHLKISDGVATLKPIAGTYKIGDGDVKDISEKLLNDEKEKAEHLMLLDLARNDLYTGCDTETVEVISSFEPEVYSHLIHIVSQVDGRIRDNVSPLRLFCNTFPAGTLSGAPKVRAIELIDQYEKSPRGFYGGCAGYFSYSQDVDTCIIIRSALVTKESVIMRAGAGIVYDSVPVKEYKEVKIKLGALFDSLQQLNTLEKKNVFIDR